jgi:CDGSH iron-sulfur domain-containing protein 3
MVSTGRSDLTVNNSEMEENKEIKPQAVVEVIDFGPLIIKGNFVLKDIKRDSEDSTSEIWLCRCGKSQNKPYCDESHKK